MTKRPHFTLEEVLDNVFSDDEDLDDPDEPIMEGSDDDFSEMTRTWMIIKNCWKLALKVYLCYYYSMLSTLIDASTK